jgi:hypothetical protein
MTVAAEGGPRSGHPDDVGKRRGGCSGTPGLAVASRARSSNFRAYLETGAGVNVGSTSWLSALADTAIRRRVPPPDGLYPSASLMRLPSMIAQISRLPPSASTNRRRVEIR